MMYSPDMVTGGRVRLADGGMVDISTGDTFDWKQSLWFGNSKVKLVCAPEMQKDGGKKKNNIMTCSFASSLILTQERQSFNLKSVLSF